MSENMFDAMRGTTKEEKEALDAFWKEHSIPVKGISCIDCAVLIKHDALVRSVEQLQSLVKHFSDKAEKAEAKVAMLQQFLRDMKIKLANMRTQDGDEV